VFFPQRHLLAIEGLHPPEIGQLLDLAESYVLLNRSGKTQRARRSATCCAGRR
jgi:aspartate carbamoyltransferase catalytic subunit